jgi:GNAT superfamily N-acetyltransferase
MQISYRVIQADEYEFLNEMLYEALFVPPGQPKFPREIIEDPSIKKYTENWNQQEDDLALVCLNGDELIGAIWGRKFSNDNKSYGFVNADTPEIGMAIKEQYRGKGLGTNLINHIVDKYAEMGLKQLSLNVNQLNPAKRLYERCGFIPFSEQENSVIMTRQLL